MEEDDEEEGEGRGGGGGGRDNKQDAQRLSPPKHHTGGDPAEGQQETSCIGGYCHLVFEQESNIDGNVLLLRWATLPSGGRPEKAIARFAHDTHCTHAAIHRFH